MDLVKRLEEYRDRERELMWEEPLRSTSRLRLRSRRRPNFLMNAFII